MSCPDCTRNQEALDDVIEEIETLEDAVTDHLPLYCYADDPFTSVNTLERIEYAGQEIRELKRQLAQIAEHHIELNKSAGRDIAKSKTYALATMHLRNEEE